MWRKPEKWLFILCPPMWVQMPPLSLSYLSGVIREKDGVVRIWDLNIQAYNRSGRNKYLWTRLNHHFEKELFRILTVDDSVWFEKLFWEHLTYNPDVIGFSVFERNRELTVLLARYFRQAGFSGTFIFGGPEIISDKNNGFVFFSRAELDGRNILFSGNDMAYFIHLLMHPGAHETIQDKALPVGRNFYLVPEPDHPAGSFSLTSDFSLFDLSAYSRKGNLPVLSSRGCIRRCRFCEEHHLSHRYVSKEPLFLYQELLEYRRRYKTRWFTFHDSLINGTWEYLDCFCSLLIQNNCNFTWDAQFLIRPDLPSDILIKMKKAGCFNLFVGLESGSDKILRLMKKGFRVKDAEKFLHETCRISLHCEISLIVGFPGETDDLFQETLEFFRRNKDIIQKVAQVNPFIPLRGSQMKNGIKNDTVVKSRLDCLLSFFRENKIMYTPAYINNLCYGESSLP